MIFLKKIEIMVQHNNAPYGAIILTLILLSSQYQEFQNILYLCSRKGYVSSTPF